jgi:voltage-gated potassium channel
MITGYSIIAVPTGIVSAEVAGARQREVSCPGCGSAVHGASAKYCDACGASLPDGGTVTSQSLSG